MQLQSVSTLTNRQKWELGLGLAVIYLPIRIYMNLPAINQAIFYHKLPLWAVEFLISATLFTLWINVIERLQVYISAFWGDDFLVKLRLLNQLFTLLIAIGLAFMFNSGFRVVWHWMEAVWENQIYEDFPVKLSDLRLQKRRGNNGITVMALMAAYYLAANKRASEKLQRVRISKERLEKENIKAHFNALKNQVSPHFLFNNFSVLTTLVETNQELSIKFINQLSKVYRYILEQSDFDFIKLGTEIDFLETYMFLLKIRFEDKLRLKIDIPKSDLQRYSIVPLTLQLLVENAVKHNQMSADNPLIISIILNENFLVISNPLQLRVLSEPSTKLGLQNIINRYKLLIDKPVIVSSKQNEFVVKIPLIQ